MLKFGDDPYSNSGTSWWGSWYWRSKIWTDMVGLRVVVVWVIVVTCIAMPIEQQNASHFQGNTSTGLQSSNVFDTTANRLGFISPIHT